MNLTDRLVRYVIIALATMAFGPAAAVNCFWSPGSQMTSSSITSMAQDAQGYLWIGTEYGLNRYDGFSYTYYLANAQDSCSLGDNHVVSLYADKEGTLWVGTRRGLQYYDAATDRFLTLHFDTDQQPRVKQVCNGPDGSLWCATSGYGLWHIVDGRPEQVVGQDALSSSSFCQTVAFDAHGALWTGDQRGCVTCLHAVKGGSYDDFLRAELPYGEIMEIVPTRGDTVFIVSEYALSCYDGKDITLLADTRRTMTLETAMLTRDGSLLVGSLSHGLLRYTGQESDPFVLVYFQREEIAAQAASVRSLLQDRMGNIWAACYLRGLMQLPAEEITYMSWSLSEDERPTSCEVTSVVDVNTNELLAVLRGKGLYHLVAERQSARYDVLPDASAIYRDKTGTHWVATSHGLYTFDPQRGTAQKAVEIEGLNVTRMTSDKQGRLYLANYGRGLLVYDPATGKTKAYDMNHPLGDDPNDRLCNDWIFDLLTDGRGNVWCATSSGFCCFDPRSETFCPFGWSELFTGHLCQCLAEDADGNIMVGTNDGIYIYNQRTRLLSEEPIPGLGLMSKSVMGIVTMPDHTAWLSTSRGIWFYDPSLEALLPFTHVEGMMSQEYNPGVACLLPRGHVLFGRHDGFVAFDPNGARNKAFSLTQLSLSALHKGGHVVRPGEKSGGRAIYEGNVTTAHDFTLAHDDNSFDMEFSSFRFNFLYRVQLEYSINGSRWQAITEQTNRITFNHLPSGKYEIRVRTKYHEMYSPESVYTVVVRHPWYSSWWMNLLYVALLLGFGTLCFMVWMRHRRTQVEDEKMQLLIDSMRDIHTPLTLILSPLHQLKERYQGEADTTRKLKAIEHNTRRILVQVNQILDVRSFDKGQMPFAPQPTDLVRMIGDHVQGFQYEAQQRNISLRYEHATEGPLVAPTDRSLLDKVVVTLLSGSMKYTPDGGHIEVRLAQEAQQAVLTVTDDGRGLPNGDGEAVFMRFRQSATEEYNDETALALNLSRKIVEMHGGTITAARRSDGQHGSVFTVCLPLAATAAAEGRSAETESVTAAPDASAVQPSRQPSRSQRVLLVDDDQEMASYIANELSGRYHVESCTNGYEALQRMLADTTHYDVLVSDIDMPEMDGLTLLRSVKSNDQLAHIPVVLLSDKSEISSRLESLSAGADAFLSKPFVIDELRATIDGLIANTLRHRSKFGGNVDAAKAATAQAADVVKDNLGPDTDSKLLERIVRVVNQHLSEADFGVDELCVEVGVSRSQLHRKMKDLTGIGAGEFVRNIRLEQAARMLKETDMNVSQVAYAVGFSNLGHFSKIFRTHFGVYPSDYGG